MEDHNVDHLAVHVKGGVDGRGQLTDGRGEKVVSGVDNGELGKESRAPGVLVGARTKVGVVAQVFGDVLSDIFVAHDDALVVRFQETNDIELKLAEDIAHAALSSPHVVVQTEMDSPDTSSDNLLLGVVGLVVVCGETQVGHGDSEKLEGCKDINVVRALSLVVGADRLASASATGVGSSRREHTSTDRQHGGDHNPVSVLTDKRTTGDESIGNNPDMEEQQEDVETETHTEGARRGVADTRGDQNGGDSHDVERKGKSTVVTSPVAVVSQKSSTDGANTVGSPATGHRGVENTIDQTGTHKENGDSTVRHGNGSTNGVSLPDPRDHSARVSQKRDNSEYKTSKANTSQKGRALLAAVGQVVTATGDSASLGTQNCQDGQHKTDLVPTSVLGVHDGPKRVVGSASKLGHARHDQTNAPAHNASLQARRVSTLGKEVSNPCGTGSGQGEAGDEQPVGRVLESVSQKTNKRSEMQKTQVLGGGRSQGGDSEKERRDDSNNGDLVARDTHVPQREVPHKDRKTGDDGPEDETVVDVGRSIEDFRPEEAFAKGVAHGLTLPKITS